MNLWALVASAAVQTVVSVAIGTYLRRAVRLNRDQLELIASALEGAVIIQGKGARVNLRNYRKAIAVGVGFLLTGLLTWASTDGVLEQLLEPLLPASLRPLVGVLAGAIATTVAVIKARNDPAPASSDEAPTIDEPVPPVLDESSLPSTEPAGTAPPAAAAIAPAPVAVTTAAAAADPGPFWAGVRGGAPTTPTSLVQLQDVPVASPL